MMKSALRIALSLIAAPAIAQTPSAPANPAAPAGQAEALGRCLALKTTGEDRLVVARWLASGLASAPQVGDIVAVKPNVKTEVDRKMAALFTRLLSVDCAAQSRPLFLAKDNAGFEVAGEVLGKVAMRELLTDPKATEALADYTKYLDAEAFKAVTK